jgi:hypothetical protein
VIHTGDFIIHGHAHVYVRTKPLAPDGTVNLKKGMVHIINGTGGATWKDAQEYCEKTAFTPAISSFPCITFLTIKENKVELQTIDARPNSQMAVIDRWSWKR